MEWAAIAVAVAVLVWFVRARLRSLRATEDRFTKFFEEIPLPMYRTRRDGTIVHANRALAGMLGIEDPAELVGINATQYYIDPGERERLASIQVDAGLLQDQISALATADGRTIWVKDSSHTIMDEGGEVFEGALVDVTKEYTSTRELQLRATQHEALARIAQVALRSTDVGVVLQEAVDRICAVVDAECVVIAQDQEGRGLLTTSVAYGVDSVLHRERVLQYVEGHLGIPDHDGPVSLPPSSELALDGVLIGLASPVRSYGVLAVAGSGFKASEEDLNFLKTTAATLGSALLRSWTSARMSMLMRSKDEFVASVSHELRTPLTVVAGLALELEQRWKQFSELELAEFISLIADQSREMGDLIEDLLVAARADIGKVPIYPEPVDLRSCVDQVVASCSLADRTRISVGGGPTIGNIDPVRVRQIIRNLVTNAIRYGGPIIRIEVRADDDEAVVSVFDDGAGIAEEDRDKIFAAYERGHQTIGVPGSVGLGLTVSQKLTELMGGSIAYRYNGGSLFEVRLPLIASVARAG